MPPWSCKIAAAGEVTELAESTGLENRRRVTYRGFESHPLRHTNPKAAPCGRFFGLWREWGSNPRL